MQYVQIFFTCLQCHRGVSSSLDETTKELPCPHCEGVIRVPTGAVSEADIARCVVCPSEELYVRKDFPQRLGVAIVAVGVVLSSITWYYHRVYLTYGIFFATAALDFVLWIVMGNLVQCYRCQAQYRGIEQLEKHGGFDLETFEKHRQQVARFAQATDSAAKPVSR